MARNTKKKHCGNCGENGHSIRVRALVKCALDRLLIFAEVDKLCGGDAPTAEFLDNKFA